jgi:exodeoxyribonuclease-3
VTYLNGFFFQAKTEAAGFTIEERESFEEHFTSKGLVDTFRKQHPNVVAYTFWGENQRISNKGMVLYRIGVQPNSIHVIFAFPVLPFWDHQFNPQKRNSSLF